MMPTLRWASSIMTAIGCQQPANWTSPYIKFLYKIYGFAVLIFVQLLTVSSILDIVFNVSTQDEIGDNLYSTIPVLISYCKLCSFLANRNSIMVLINSLQEKPYSPVDDTEVEIETRFDKLNEKITSLYTTLTEITVMVICITSMIRDSKNRMLAFRAWIPYNYSSLTLYTVTYAYQVVSMTLASLINVAYDSVFSGLIFCVYSQLKILGHRLQNISNNQKETARECARHLNFIYEFAAKMNENFQVVLAIQFLSSVMIICFTLYRITQTDLGSKLAETCMYAVCMLLQIFYYCWYGNEVRLKSLEIPDLIFSSNWVSLDNTTKKILLIIMIRATFPIEFTTARILSVNINSFMAVLKTSYSAYNVL